MPTFHTEESRAAWLKKCQETRLRNKQKRGTIILLDGIQSQVDEIDHSIEKLRQMKANLLRTAQQFKDTEYLATTGSA